MPDWPIWASERLPSSVSGSRYGRWLVVTTSQMRLENLLRRTEQAGGDELFYFTTFDRLQEAADHSATGVLTDPLWLVAGSRKLTSLIPDVNVRAG